MTATSIVEEDDEVVAAAWAVLEGDAPEGTEDVRSGETEAGAEFAYRVDLDAAGDLDAEVDPDDLTPGGEFPDAEVTSWRADREEVEREVGRRDIEGTRRLTVVLLAGLATPRT